MVNNDTYVLGRRHGSSSPEVLPFTFLSGPHGVAVDSAGNVYMTDYSNNRVLELLVQ